MNKIFFSILIACVMIFSLSGCGDEHGTTIEDTSVNTNLHEDNLNESIVTENTTSDLSFDNEFLFVGFKGAYPKDEVLDDSSYGHIFRNSSGAAVIIESPCVAGIMLDVKGFDEIIEATQQYVCATFETKVRELFSFDATAQEVTESTEISVNGIAMLKVKGVFTNLTNNEKVEYVGYYTLIETDPVYFIGIPLDDNLDIEKFMEQFVQNISN